MRNSLSICISRLLLTALLGGASPASGLPTGAPAQAAEAQVPAPTAPTPVLTLPQLLQALRSAPGWRAADLSYRAAELQLQSAQVRAGLSLQVGANAALSKYPWEGGDWRLSPTLSVSFAAPLLPWSPQREAVRVAERALSGAATELRSSRAALTLQAVQAYASARNAAASAELAQAQLALAEAALSVARNQREENLISQAALLDRQAAVVQARAGAEQAGRGLTLQAAQLARLLGRGVTLPAQAADYLPVGTLVPMGLTEQPLPMLVERARTRRPEVARAQAALADAQVALATAQRDQVLPDLSASVQVGQFASPGGRTLSSTFALKSGTLSGQASWPLREPTSTVTAPGPDGVPVSREVALPSGLALSVGGTFPLLGGARTAAAQAQAGVAQAALAVQSAEQGTELEVRSRLADLEGARENLGVAQSALTRAEQVLSDARARLDAGLGTLLDVQQAEVALKQARNAVDSAGAQVALAALGLAQATGDLDPLLVGPG